MTKKSPTPARSRGLAHPRISSRHPSERRQQSPRQGRETAVVGCASFHAFTLVELLVVIAIVGILAGLILSAIGKSKAYALSAQCQNNHHELILAWHLYASEAASQMPLNFDAGSTPGFTNWVAGQLLGNPDEATNTAILVDPRRSLLAPFLPSPKVYKCPSDPSSFARSVSMNNRMNPVRYSEPPLVLGGYGTNFMVYRRQVDIGNPSLMFVTLDERYDSINEAYFAVDLSNTGELTGEGAPSPYWWIDTPAGYHSQSLTLSFADGHVESHRWLENSTLGPIGQVGPRHTSSHDRDIAWLQQHTAERKPGAPSLAAVP